MLPRISEKFPRYIEHNPSVPVWCVTPNSGRSIHRYFDSSPFSPSGRLLAAARLPYENRLPSPGDDCQIVITDLASGDERVVTSTKGWDTQVGPHIHWGINDDTILFNDLDPVSWRPYSVIHDLRTGKQERLDGPIYTVSSDKRFAITPNLSRTGLVQAGYGVVTPSHVPAAEENDGIYRTDLDTGLHHQLISLAELSKQIGPSINLRPNQPGFLLGFHMSMNRDNSRLLCILRWMWQPTLGKQALLDLYRHASRPARFACARLRLSKISRKIKLPSMVFNTLVTMGTDGSNIKVVIPAERYAAGGHHPNWCPDGRSILMNLRVDGIMRLMRFDVDAGTSQILGNRITGSGHPTLHPNNRHVLTDCYPFEAVAPGDGTSLLRLIDTKANTESSLVRIAANADFKGPKLEMRLDPHPAWNEQFNRIAFNGYAGGTRRVYVADLDQIGL